MKKMKFENKVRISDLLYIEQFPSDVECYYKGTHILINPFSSEWADITWGSGSLDEEVGAPLREVFDVPIIEGKTLRQMAEHGELTWTK